MASVVLWQKSIRKDLLHTLLNLNSVLVNAPNLTRPSKPSSFDSSMCFIKHKSWHNAARRRTERAGSKCIPVPVPFRATQNHLFWGSALMPDLITSWWCVWWLVASSLCRSVTEEREVETRQLPSPSLCGCLCWHYHVLLGGGQELWSSAKSRLWFMIRGTRPKYWSELASSHPPQPLIPQIWKTPLCFCPCLRFIFISLSHPDRLSFLFLSLFCVSWIVPHLQPLWQEEQPGTVEQARPNLPVQGEYSPVTHRRATCQLVLIISARTLSETQMAVSLKSSHSSSHRWKQNQLIKASSCQENMAASPHPFKQKQRKVSFENKWRQKELRAFSGRQSFGLPLEQGQSHKVIKV